MTLGGAAPSAPSGAPPSLRANEELILTGEERLREYSIEACARAIRERNAELCAVITVLDEPERIADTPANSPLGGVPYVLKDVWDTANIRTTGGSFRHKDRLPKTSARCYEVLSRAGAVLLGKSNLGDLAFSAESNNHIMGPVKNPLDLPRTAGGSTGGGAAAVCAGMAAFDWGTDFGGSIRSPAAFCGLVGLRLSNDTWPVEREHFPRISSHFWSWCGQGPITRTVAESAALVSAMRELRTRPKTFEANPSGVVLYSPDKKHAGAWPGFTADATKLLEGAGLEVDFSHGLPSPTRVNEIFAGYLCSHLEEMASSEEMGVMEGLPIVLSGLGTLGRLDKRMHPNTALLFALLGVGRITLYRNKKPWQTALDSLRDAAWRIWKSGRLIVSPTTTLLPPKHGRAAFAYGLQTFQKLGNMTDATSIAIPFGTFEAAPHLPRSLLISGPPGSEDAVLALAARLEAKLVAS
jgi:Asp-tRNA(Asn)/Glu-tRNA(Gln) amidotransferase A subunit family amidase